MSHMYSGGQASLPANSTNTPEIPRPGRTVGPVTMATGGAVAVTTLIVGVLDRVGIPVSTLEQGAISVCLVMLAGWAVYPNGRRSK